MIRTHRLQLINSSKCLSGKPRNEPEVSQYTALDYTALFCASGVVLPVYVAFLWGEGAELGEALHDLVDE
jgi:hypothetical protein